MPTNQPGSEVRIAKNVAYKIIIRKAIRSALAMVLLAIVTYGAIASTMARYVPTNLGILKVISTNFIGEHAPPGTEVLINPSGNYDNMPWTNLFMAFTAHSSVLRVKIIQGPYGDADWKSFGIERDASEKLQREYIFECLEGCWNGSSRVSFGVLKESWIMGIPVGEES